MKEKYREIPRYKISRREESSSSSVSEESESQPKRSEELFDILKKALLRKDQREVYTSVRNLSTFRDDLGILRITIPNAFSFQKADLQEFFEQFGRVENFIIKEPREPKEEKIRGQGEKERERDEREKRREEDPDIHNCNIAYVIYSQEFSAILALKVLQSVSANEKIVDARLCTLEASMHEEDLFNPLIGQFDSDEFLLRVESDDDIEEHTFGYNYVGTIGVDLQERNFQLRDRVLGASSANFLRVHYYCEKAIRLENQGGDVSADDLVLKLICPEEQIERTVLVMSNSILRYNTAVRCLHELFEQIIEEYKNSREKTGGIIPKDVHIRRWEKFTAQPTLKFLQSSDDKRHLD